MKKLFYFILFALALYCSTSAQNQLKFRQDGKFKVVQFTDVHYIHGDSRCDIALENMRSVLDAEQPDFVIITGDLIFGKPAKESILDVLNVISEKKIPFAYTFGNHDDESGLSRKELYEITKAVPFNMTSTVEGLTGVTNYILPLNSSKSDKPALLIYVFDSNSYSKIEGIKGYDFIHYDQIEWYRKNSQTFTQNNAGTPIPSVALFHIPVPEYTQAAKDENAFMVGTRGEAACPAQNNSGLFTAMREMGDIMAIFVGHDHDDDYAVMWQNILLAYGRYTGGKTVYNNLGLNGGRVIEFHEGERRFNSWIRLRDGSVVNQLTYPDTFKKN